MPLIVCSKSTLKYAKEMEGRVYQVTHPPNKGTLGTVVTADEIIAIGGGSVIDTAKIFAEASGIRTILAYPTTGAGASSTSHAVYWDKGRKCVIDTPMPSTVIRPEFAKGLPKWIATNSDYDARSHANESLLSVNRTDVSYELAMMVLRPNSFSLIERGVLAGKAIEITGTNVVHALSYPLTGHYRIPHGQAVGIMDVQSNAHVPDKDYDIDFLVSEAMSYPQIKDSVFAPTVVEVRSRYKRALCL